MNVLLPPTPVSTPSEMKLYNMLMGDAKVLKKDEQTDDEEAQIGWGYEQTSPEGEADEQARDVDYQVENMLRRFQERDDATAVANLEKKLKKLDPKNPRRDFQQAAKMFNDKIGRTNGIVFSENKRSYAVLFQPLRQGTEEEISAEHE